MSLLVALCVAPAAFAQEWLSPERFTDACGAMTVRMATMNAVAPNRVTRAIEKVPTKRLNLTPEQFGQTIQFPMNVPAGAIAIVAVDLAPMTLNRTAAEVQKYLDDIGASDAVRAQWAAHPEHWRESAASHAKTFLRCGESHDSYQTASDMDLELVPQGTDPTSLKRGAPLRVILIGKNHLCHDVSVALVREVGGRVAMFKPAESGVVSFVAPEPGRYMLIATTLRPSDDNKDVDWVSESTTLSFEVK